MRFDPLMVDFEFKVKAGKYTALLARGSPYVTVKFDGATPFLMSDAFILNWEKGGLDDRP